MTSALPSPYTLEHARAFIAQTHDQYAAGQTVSLRVHLQESGALTGIVSLRLSLSHRSGHLGYWTGIQYQNQGYACEAAKGLLRHGFTDMNLNRIAGQCFSDNPASAVVPRSAGYRMRAVPERHF